jgi:hypothetical protein
MGVTAAWNTLTGLTRAAIRLSTVLMTPTGSLTVRSGVVPGGTPLLLTGSVMTGSIAPGRAVVQGTSAQGAYPVAVDAATAITVANGHASLGRIDTVFLVVLDTDYDSSGSRQASIVYTQGTASASPTAPTAPASGTAYLRLWDILVPAGASSGSPINWGTALTDQRVYSVAVGGIGLGAIAGAYAGHWRAAGGTAGILERYTGAAWEAAVRLGNAGRLEAGDVNWYRGSANVWKTDDGVQVVGALTPLGGISNLPTAYVEDTTTRTTTSGTYNAVGSTLSAAIVAPPSGKVRVTLGGKIQAVGSGGNPVFGAPLITGSVTTTIAAPADISGIATYGVNDYILQTVSRIVTAVPGETVTVVYQGRAAAGTCTLIYRNLTVEALAG